jgi:hypothetical protein
MITVYLDETEHSESGKYTVVAGFRGRKENWERFTPLWEEGLGKRKSLHMKSLRWNDPRAEKRIKPLLARLGRIPYDCGLIPVYGAVKADDYLDLVKGVPRLEKSGGYLLSIGHVFTVLLANIPPTERIAIVSEEQREYDQSVRDLFGVLKTLTKKESLSPQLASINFVPKGSTSLIEPSDYLAFSLGKTFSESGSKKDLWSRPIQDSCSSLGAESGIWLSREAARETVRQIRAELAL